MAAGTGGGGDAKTDLLWLVVILAVLGLVWFFTGGPTRPQSYNSPFIRPPAPLDSSRTTTSSESVYRGYGSYDSSDFRDSLGDGTSLVGRFSIDRGTASYEYQPNQEYIAINYYGGPPVNLAGWYLTNGKNLRGGISDRVPLPTITALPSDGRLVITSGTFPVQSPVPVGNFLVNKCSGYVEDLPDYDFNPSLSTTCPDPRQEADVNRLDQECYNFVRGISSCQTPQFTRDGEGNDLVDNRPSQLNGQCRDFIRSNFNYQSCVNRHYNDSDFYTKEWRLFLNRTREMWSSDRETITLYDRDNNIMAQLKY